MLDVNCSTEVTEDPQPLQLAPPDHRPIKAHPCQQATHWTRRLPDPLGAALLSLKKTRATLEDVDAASSSWQSAALAKPQRFAGSQQQVVWVEPQSTESAPETLESAPALEHGNSAETEQPVSGRNRRCFPRRQSECSVTLLERHETNRLTPQEIDWWLQSSRTVGRLIDISQTGLCMQFDREITKDTEVLLRISNQQLNRQLDSVAKVISSSPIAPGKFSVHCRTLHDFTLAELQDLGRPVIEGHVLA